MKRVVIILIFVLNLGFLQSQNPVNAYAEVTAIAGTSLSLGTVNETFHSFEDGDYVIIMQMQDNVIGTNTTNVVSFGDVGTIQSAGLFEVAQISAHTEAALVPTSITFAASLVNSYHINANASVQLITFRFLGANFTTTTNIGTLAWNGVLGGVTALQVTNMLTLSHNISANGSGFAGGARNNPNGYSGCDNSTYATAVAARYATKGFGIYKNTNTSIDGARGKMLNGGGGGNDVNAGGGGGGNYLSGGGGGSGWTGSSTGCSPLAGGLGGVSLSPYVSGTRVFMGGGGGGGHQNDNNGTIGAAGGGILLIRATALTTSACGAAAITANGNNALTAGNDGAGGGGAGGSIIFDVSTFNATGGCPLTVSANGGSGGNSNSGGSDSHGGGGGGAQGVIIYPATQPTVNVTSATIPGAGGISCGSCVSSVNGAPGAGPSNAGILPNSTTILPIELLSFNAALNKAQQVEIRWATAIEKDSKEFVLQRMNNENEILDLAVIASTGSNSTYSFIDGNPEIGINYYRLKQVDLDGTLSYKQWAVIEFQGSQNEVIIFPDPMKQGSKLIFMYSDESYDESRVEILNMESRIVLKEIIPSKKQNRYELNTSTLPAGIYLVKIQLNEMIRYKKLVITE